jgi:hypothetical protein
MSERMPVGVDYWYPGLPSAVKFLAQFERVEPVWDFLAMSRPKAQQYTENHLMPCLSKQQVLGKRGTIEYCLSDSSQYGLANRSATCLVCASCGYIHWFLVD